MHAGRARGMGSLELVKDRNFLTKSNLRRVAVAKHQAPVWHASTAFEQRCLWRSKRLYLMAQSLPYVLTSESLASNRKLGTIQGSDTDLARVEMETPKVF